MSFLYSFFQPFCHHFYLHSFPTRRSSDLFDDESVPVENVLETLQKFIDKDQTKLIGASNFSEERLKQALSLAKTDDFPKDRKSTRLNSSHVAISYAVFCLKKKNILSLMCM